MNHPEFGPKVGAVQRHVQKTAKTACHNLARYWIDSIRPIVDKRATVQTWLALFELFLGLRRSFDFSFLNWNPPNVDFAASYGTSAAPTFPSIWRIGWCLLSCRRQIFTVFHYGAICCHQRMACVCLHFTPSVEFSVFVFTEEEIFNKLGNVVNLKLPTHDSSWNQLGSVRQLRHAKK